MMLTKLHKPFLKFVNDREGTSIVEFAVISPVMFTLLFGGFDFGHGSGFKCGVTCCLIDRTLQHGLHVQGMAKVEAAKEQREHYR